LLGRRQVPRRSKKWVPYLEEIEQAKIALCEGRKDAVEIEIDEAEGGTFHLDRGRLERLLKELWTDDEKPLGPGFRGFLRRVRRLARDHGQLLDFEQIESVFLAGGSVGLPGLEERVQEDLRRLNLLPDEAKEGQTTSTIRPRRRLFGDRVTPSSSLAALGQVASIAEKNRERILEEGEEIYALVRGPDGIRYPFERQNAGPADPKYDGEFLLCTLDELEERNTVRFEPDGTDRFEDIEIGEEYPPLEEAEIYLRANVNRFQDSPDRTFSQSEENGGRRGSDSDTDEDPDETRARFTAHAELRPDRLRIKPFLWTVQPQEDHRRTLDADDDGYLSVSLRPDHPDDDTVHVGVDLGMNNTAVALYAPGRDIPNRSDLEVFTLQPTRRSVTSYLRGAFPSEQLSLDDVMAGIEDAHQAIGYRPTVRGAYRLLRGAFVDAYAQSLYTGSSNELSRSEVTDRALNDVLEAMTKEAGRCRLDVSTLRREVRIARAIQQWDGDDVTTNLEVLISEKASEPGAEEALPDLDTIEEIIRNHSHDGTESQASQEPSSNGTDEGRDKRPSDTSDSPTIPNADVEDGTTPTTRDTTDSHRPSSDRSSDHWALGMTEWMEERVEQMVDPIRQSNEATREAVKELSNRLEAVSDTLENNAPETNATQGQELADAVRGVESHLEDLVSATQRRERESGTSIDVQKRIEEQIQEESEDPLAELTTGELDTSLDALKKFVEEKGYIYPEKVLRRAWMHCVSDASSLVILAGPPGCGKTSLVRLLAEFFNRDLAGDGWESYHLLQPVSPNWFSPESLLGSRSVMTGEYQYTPFLKFLLRAEAHFVKALSGPGREHARQFVACLDEFNIAQPEQYLADLLSKMEAPVDSANRRLRLGEDGAGGSVVDVDLTGNLKLFGTINTDSTTKTLSPKVLDRAIYVPLSPEVDSLNQAADRFQERFEVPEPVHDQFTEVLGELAKLARSGQAPVAYRSIEQGYAYAGSHPEAETSPDAVIQDVLISFFLSKLPGAYAINDPAGTYRNQLQECNTLRQYDEVARLLDRIETGLPGQAAL
jgi:MoxR-like ATPase